MILSPDDLGRAAHEAWCEYIREQNGQLPLFNYDQVGESQRELCRRIGAAVHSLTVQTRILRAGGSLN